MNSTKLILKQDPTSQHHKVIVRHLIHNVYSRKAQSSSSSISLL